jgi:glycerol kinase
VSAALSGFVLAIDQGTTSTRSILFDGDLEPIASAQQEFPQLFPQPGWVEHDPEAIWASVLATARQAIAEAGVAPASIAAIGLTNQRETVVVWDRATGKPIHNAIVWQDRRTANACANLRAEGAEAQIAKTTGLLADPYFSATKLQWILNTVPGAAEAARQGRLCFGTIDTFLMWRLTGGKSFVTDATNASRTMLYDLGQGRWSADMLALFGVPEAMLPKVLDCAADFGTTDPALFGAAIPILGVAGDQQAATVGQACFEPGMVKSTYGTGCFALMNVGAKPVFSRHRLLTTLAYQLDGRPTYALEGAIFIAGAAVQWLRDGLGIIAAAPEVNALAESADDEHAVVMVPAFVGLGAPYWDAECRGAIFGLTRGAGRAELARAALESVCFQTLDLIDAMRKDWGADPSTVLRVDGGMAASNWTMQRLADLLASPVDRPRQFETTARGAAYLAGLRAGLYPAPAEFARSWALERRFTPAMAPPDRSARIALWRDAVRRTLVTPPQPLPIEGRG